MLFFFFPPPLAGDRSWNFKVTTSTRYTRPGAIKVLENPLCSALFCTMRCILNTAECRVVALNKRKCQCYLYNNDYYTNTNENVTDTEWDLFTSYHYNGKQTTHDECKRQYYLYNNDFYANSNENVTDIEWDLFTSFYHN